MPFLILVVVWIVAYFMMRVGQQRELQREIDDLNDIERQNRL
jgi:preprotein translocase subunit YajC